jgi:hypothetical protein
VHSCALDATADALKIELSQVSLASPAQPGDLLRCRCNRFKATVSSPTGNPPPVSTARFFWTTASNPVWQVGNQTHFKEVWNSTRLIPSQGYPHTFEIEWEVGKNIEAGSTITLLAIADSPHSKIPSGGTGYTMSDLLADTTQASALTLKVINPSKCCLFPCKGGTSSCN